MSRTDNIKHFEVTTCCESTDLINTVRSSAVARALIGGGGGGGSIFIYSCSARLISIEMNLKTTDFKRFQEICRAEHEYMNIHPPPPQSDWFSTRQILAHICLVRKTRWQLKNMDVL